MRRSLKPTSSARRSGPAQTGLSPGRLLGNARPTDTVARIGGDEFAMIIRGDDSLGAALAVAERLMAAFDEEFEVDGVRLQISCSVGIADGVGATVGEEIIRHADAAM